MDLTRVDPDLMPALDRMHVLDMDDVVTARRNMREMLEAVAFAAPAGVRHRDVTVAGLPGEPEARVRVYQPVAEATTPRGCLVWMHGGGHVMGGVEQDDAWCSSVVADHDAVVVSVEWRLAPENPFPAAIHDCYAALLWTSWHRAELGIDPARIAIGGLSSGGGLAAGLALMARDRAEVPVAFQLLVYPMLDDRCATPSAQEITDERVWNVRANRLAWRHYLGGEAPPRAANAAYAAPARAEDLAGLPPAFIAVGELDLFRDECITYAQRLLQQAVPTELHVYPGAFHGFDIVAPLAPVSQRLKRDRDDALARVIGRPRPASGEDDD